MQYPEIPVVKVLLEVYQRWYKKRRPLRALHALHVTYFIRRLYYCIGKLSNIVAQNCMSIFFIAVIGGHVAITFLHSIKLDPNNNNNITCYKVTNEDTSLHITALECNSNSVCSRENCLNVPR